MTNSCDDLEEIKIVLKTDEDTKITNSDKNYHCDFIHNSNQVDTHMPLILDDNIINFNVSRTIKSDLFLSVRNNKYDRVMQILSCNVPIDICDDNHNTILHMACRYNNKKIAKLCLKFNADLNVQNIFGYTPLHYCFMYNFYDLGAYLISKGAYDNIEDNLGRSCYDVWRVYPPTK